jgi:hypothetical protein
MEIIMPLIVSFPRRAQCLLLALALLLPSAFASAVVFTPQEQEIFNDLHQSARPFIVADPILTKVARDRARDMAVRGYFAHVNPDGVAANYLVQQAGYDLPDSYGSGKSDNYIESISAGRATASEAWGDWMGSAPHKKHLMAEDSFYAEQTSVGVGFYEDPGSEYQYYWVVITAPPQPKPALTITTPTAGAQVTVPQVAVSGTTGGAIPAKTVAFRVENAVATSNWTTAAGLANWSGTVFNLTPGTNTIRVRSLDATGATLLEAARKVTYLQYKPLTVNLSGSGSVTDGFAGTTNRAIGLTYTIKATAAAGQIFAGWTGSVSSKAPSLTFEMREGFSLTANFIPNPFLTRKGGYTGLLQGGDAGSVTVVVTPAGQFTGRVTVAGKTYALAGRFDATGAASLSLASGLNVSLHLDTNGASGVSGSISGTATGSFSAAAAYRPANGDYPHAGRYTVLLPPDPSNSDPSLPRGNGWGVLSIATTGRAHLSGALADGRAIVANVPVTSNDQLALYIPLYNGAGSVSGTVTVRNTSASDLDGLFHWTKPEISNAQIHPAALDVNLPVIGSQYVKPAAGQTALGLADTSMQSAIQLAEGNLLTPIVQDCTLNLLNQIVAARQPLDTLSAVVNPANGVFAGTFVHPVTGRPTTFRGVIFQKQNAGYGYFLGSDESGSASLVPQL